jgi:pimeloyl-ACP methyl ester carboxylesterase
VIRLAPTVIATALLLQVSALGQSEPSGPGVLVQAAGHRIHVYCTGLGSPAVVLLPGMGSFSFDWALTQPGLSTTTRTCSYDRSGAAWSDPGPKPRTLRQEAYTVSEALKSAGVPPPYVLVGQSIGGVIARLFARQYPDRVVGIVLVDSTSENSTLIKQGKRFLVREGSTGRAIPVPRNGNPEFDRLSAEDRREMEAYIAKFVRPRIEAPFDKLPEWARQARVWALSQPESLGDPGEMMAEEFAEMYDYINANPIFLGSIPLIVLANAATATEDHKAMAALSRNSLLIAAPKSGHHMQIEDPDLVICAVSEAIAALRRPNALLGPTSCRAR